MRKAPTWIGLPAQDHAEGGFGFLPGEGAGAAGAAADCGNEGGELDFGDGGHGPSIDRAGDGRRRRGLVM